MRRRGSFHPGCVVALVVLAITASLVASKVKDLTASRGLAIVSGLAVAYSPFLVFLGMASLGAIIWYSGALSWIERLGKRMDERFYARLRTEEEQAIRQRQQRARERRRHREMKRRRESRRRNLRGV
jgi:hypothetical protein